ncbi:AfsA-related hotdog domain-containing protein [Williamsia sp.]|uniref:AfsA-related hotdog domain-containing protein n=1 Tax=Williamsia sp. TaxID=1872085 RepID=UPI002F93DC1A
MADNVIQVVVVGDRFEGFCCRANVYTVSAFVSAARSGDFTSPDQSFEVVIGQGVTTYETELIEHTLVRFSCSTVCVMRHPQSKLVPRHLVHKCDPSNVLIANLERVGSASFQAVLRIHNNNELLIDHQTGQHVQGMVIVEATRQNVPGCLRKIPDTADASALLPRD